jgi:hypothetical protein
MRESSQLGIEQMANLLAVRKNSHQPTVLLLGARAGRLFRSAPFYNNLQLFSNRNFQELSSGEQFQECYTILTSNKFSETDLHIILQESLKDVGVIEADVGLAFLIKHEYFNEIISTNIDDGLEDALLHTDMKEGRHYEVIRIGSSTSRHEKSSSCRIIKPFGDLVSRVYTVNGRASHLENTGSRALLQSLLEKNLLVVGIDPIWDQDIVRILPAKASGAMWFVSEEEEIIKNDSFLEGALNGRSSSTILGTEGCYDYFVPKICHFLYGTVSPTYPLAHSPTLQNIQYQVATVFDLFPTMTDQLTSITTVLPGMAEQLTSITALLPGIYSQLTKLREDNLEALKEIQALKSNLEEMKKERYNC